MIGGFLKIIIVFLRDDGDNIFYNPVLGHKNAATATIKRRESKWQNEARDNNRNNNFAPVSLS